MKNEQLQAALKKLLPNEEPGVIARFEKIILELVAQRDPQEAAKHINIPQDAARLVEQLNGRNIVSEEVLLSFGSKNNIGDIAIRDVVHGNTYNFVFNLLPSVNVSSYKAVEINQDTDLSGEVAEKNSTDHIHRRSFRDRIDDDFISQQRAFDYCLRRAFPGTSGFTRIDDPQGLNRILSLLAEKYIECGLYWYQGVMNSQVTSIKRMPNSIWLINSQTVGIECKIKEVWVNRSNTQERQLLLLHLSPQPPFGIYNTTNKSVIEIVHEEACLVNGAYVTIEEYNDGFALIDGEPTPIDNYELRQRNIKDDFLVLAPHYSVLHDTQNQLQLQYIYRDLIASKQIAMHLEAVIGKFIRPPWMAHWD